MELAACFTSPGHDQRLSLDDFRLCIDGKSSGAVRVSVGLVSNFEDVQAFLKFAESLLSRHKYMYHMPVPTRAQLKPGLRVRIVLKQDQPTGKLTEGILKDILTSSPTHPHGIKVRLMDGQVGRVKEIVRVRDEN